MKVVESEKPSAERLEARAWWRTLNTDQKDNIKMELHIIAKTKSKRNVFNKIIEALK